MNRLLLLLALPLAACASPAAKPRVAAASDAKVQMVSSADRRASEAGLAMLRAGGSATDAAAAIMFALTVVEPQSSGIGGGGFLVHHAANGELSTLDGRETAPAAATPGQFLKTDGTPQPMLTARAGGLSVGVPGNIAMIAEAHRRWGKLPWARLFQPAIALARDGFEVTPQLARFTDRARELIATSPATAAIYLDPDDGAKDVGTRLTNPDLARSLELIAAGGPDAFYQGPVAAAVVAAVAQAPRNPVRMTAADLAGYRAKQREPVCGMYRAWKVCGMGPPSSGGIAVLAILKQLEGFDLAKLGPDSPVAWHLFAESLRLAYADRDAYLGDPDFVRVPVAGLTDAAYLKARGAPIRADTRLASVAAGRPAGALAMTPANDNDVPSTSHFVAVDKAGNVASLTSTIEGTFGSGQSAGGIMLNNELTDFNFQPEEGGKPVANAVAPGKRPRSSMAPTIVYDRDGRVVLALGAAGGTTIIAQVAKTIIGVLDFGLPVQDAIALPQVFAIGDRFAVEQGTKLEAMLPAFAALGHKPSASFLPLKLNAVEAVPGGWRGGADPRTGEGSALGD